MANQIVGTILSISETQSFPTKRGTTFTKRDLVLSLRKFDTYTGELYSDQSNTPMLTFTGERTNDLNKFSVGQTVRVKFELNGRSYVDADGKTRYLTDIRGYAIEPFQQSGTVAPQEEDTFHPATAPVPPAQPAPTIAPFAEILPSEALPQSQPKPAVASPTYADQGDQLPF